MTDPAKFQPKDGDFVSYIEKIQQESERKLARASSVPRPNTDEARTLRDMAGELYRQSAADKAEKAAAVAKAEAQAETIGVQIPAEQDPVRTQSEAAPGRRSVADEFRNAPSAPAPVSRSRRTAPRSARALGILLLFAGALIFISCLQAGLDELVPIAFFLIFSGFVFVQIGSKR